MKYKQLKTSKIDRVGVITISHPPRNGFSKRMCYEMLEIMQEFLEDDEVRTVMLNSEGPDFSRGADFDDLTNEIDQTEDVTEDFSTLGGKLVEMIDNYPKPTIVAARGVCFGGSSAIFSAFDIRIVSETFEIHDGDIYYGTVGSWGMSSLRLPLWIGRNKVLDYMFLNEGFSGRQAYELGIVSKVLSDELLDEVSLHYAKKMSKAAPIAVRYYKECVRLVTAGDLSKAREFEQKAAETVYQTEDCKNGLKTLIENEDEPMCEFNGR